MRLNERIGLNAAEGFDDSVQNLAELAGHDREVGFGLHVLAFGFLSGFLLDRVQEGQTIQLPFFGQYEADAVVKRQAKSFRKLAGGDVILNVLAVERQLHKVPLNEAELARADANLQAAQADLAAARSTVINPVAEAA